MILQMRVPGQSAHGDVAGALGDRLGAVPVLNMQGSMYIFPGVLAFLLLGKKAEAVLKGSAPQERAESGEP